MAAIPCNTLAPFPFLDLIYSLITMYKHNRHRGNTSRNRSHNTNLSIYGPQAGWLCYRDGDNGGGGGATRFALRDDDDVATGDALRLGHPVWHAPGELARDSGSMSSGTSLLRGSHHGRNHSGGNGGGATRFALGDDDDVATGDALRSGHPVWHAPGELARDSGSMSSGTSLLRGSHHGRNHSGGNGGGATRFALRDDDDVATGDALRSGHPVWHAPGELARDSGSMSSGTSLLRGSHQGRNRSGGNGGWRQKICFAAR